MGKGGLKRGGGNFADCNLVKELQTNPQTSLGILDLVGEREGKKGGGGIMCLSDVIFILEKEKGFPFVIGR